MRCLRPTQSGTPITRYCKVSFLIVEALIVNAGEAQTASLSHFSSNSALSCASSLRYIEFFLVPK